VSDEGRRRTEEVETEEMEEGKARKSGQNIFFFNGSGGG